MARKNKERIILEDIELKPQVIGYTYQKKSNIGRVIIIFVIFLLAVFYINDISVFINNLLGKNTASTIGNNTSKKENDNENKETNPNEVVYNIYSNTLEIREKALVLNNFNLINNKLTFDIVNDGDVNIDFKDKKYFLETYTSEKTLLERYKVDIKDIASKAKVSYSIDINNSFYYLVLEEKSIDDYPKVNLEVNDVGVAQVTCTKDYEKIVYTFRNDELTEISHTISENDPTKDGYYNRYNAYQNKATNYNNIEGITATFNSSLNGYSAVIAIDLANVNLSTVEEIYYYGYKEEPKVVKFEMQTYGFNCN